MHDWRIRAAGAALLLMVLGGSLAAADDLTLYVSATGNDAFSGTAARMTADGSDGPLATLEAARDRIRQRRANGEPLGTVRVRLTDRHYALERTFQLTPADSGTDAHPVIYEAVDGVRPVLSGGRTVTGWQPLTDTPPGLHPDAHGQLWVARIEPGWRPALLYADGQPLPVAAWPNEGFLEGEQGLQAFGDPSPRGQLITFPESVREFIHLLPNNGAVEMSWIPIIWANGISVLRDFDPAANTAWRHSKNILYPGNPASDWMRGNRFRLLNALHFIDSPGEWCVDSEQGCIYLWPRETTPDQQEIVAPRLYELIRLEGDEAGAGLVRHVTFRGLELRYTDRLPEDEWPDEWLKRNFENPDAALFMKDVEHITVTDCRIVHVGAYGITGNQYTRFCRIAGNEIGYTGCGGVQLLGYGPGRKDVNRDNRIVRNHIHHCGNNDYMHSAAVSLYQSGNNDISLNYIHDCPYAGIVPVGASDQHLNRVSRWGWQPDSKWVAGHTDAYGEYENQYQVRWDELPTGSYERMMNDAGTWTLDNYKPYNHTKDNDIGFNIVARCMRGLADGGALYCFSCYDHRWHDNVVLASGDKTIYLDDGVQGAIIEDNVCWGDGGTISKRDGTGNLWTGNRFGHEQRPAGYARALRRIVKAAENQGGWLGGMAEPVPTVEVRLRRGSIFHRDAWVDITAYAPGTIRRTLDGSDPTPASPAYTAPLHLADTTTVTAALFDNGTRRGPVDVITFHRVPRPRQPDLLLTGADFTVSEDPGKLIEFPTEVMHVRNRPYVEGVAFYTRDQLSVPLRPEYRRFVAWVAVDDLSDPRAHGQFEIKIDGTSVYTSAQHTTDTLPEQVDIVLPAGSRELTISGTTAGSMYWVFLDFIRPGFVLQP